MRSPRAACAPQRSPRPPTTALSRAGDDADVAHRVGEVLRPEATRPRPGASREPRCGYRASACTRSGSGTRARPLPAAPRAVEWRVHGPALPLRELHDGGGQAARSWRGSPRRHLANDIVAARAAYRTAVTCGVPLRSLNRRRGRAWARVEPNGVGWAIQAGQAGWTEGNSSGSTYRNPAHGADATGTCRAAHEVVNRQARSVERDGADPLVRVDPRPARRRHATSPRGGQVDGAGLLKMTPDTATTAVCAFDRVAHARRVYGEAVRRGHARDARPRGRRAVDR